MTWLGIAVVGVLLWSVVSLLVCLVVGRGVAIAEDRRPTTHPAHPRWVDALPATAVDVVPQPRAGGPVPAADRPAPVLHRP